MFEYDKDSQAAAEELDRYDFQEILESCASRDLRSPYDIQDAIRMNFPQTSDAIENLTGDEWRDYLTARYPVRFVEEITYRMICTRW